MGYLLNDFRNRKGGHRSLFMLGWAMPRRLSVRYFSRASQIAQQTAQQVRKRRRQDSSNQSAASRWKMAIAYQDLLLGHRPVEEPPIAED